MTVRLRAHHLLCLLTYVGKGYSPAFTANYDAIAARLSRGEDILVVEGPDDVCAPLLCQSGAHCRKARVTKRDKLAARDLKIALGLSADAESTITLEPALLMGMRTAFANKQIRSACRGCEWSKLCSSIAGGGYCDTRVNIEPSAPGATSIASSTS